MQNSWLECALCRLPHDAAGAICIGTITKIMLHISTASAHAAYMLCVTQAQPPRQLPHMSVRAHLTLLG